MFSALWKLTLRTANLIDRYAPTNVLLHRLQTRNPARWPALASIWGAGFLAAALLVTVLVAVGLPKPFYLLFFLFLYDSGKFLATSLRGIAARRRALFYAARR